jgi:hypothetical protein
VTLLERRERGPLDDPTRTDGSGPEGRHAGCRGWRSLLAGAIAYLALSVGVWWNIWSTHPTSTTTCGCGDTSLFTWFLEWPAFAISHGLNPLYSTYMFHPTGVNLLSNTAEVGVGVLLAPVTWLFGPVATLNVALTLSPFLSALAAYVLARRFVSWAPAAFAAGLLYGFSPFVLTSLSDAHLMLGLAPVPPLIVLCLDEMVVRQRWRPVAVGLALGLLATVQFFIGTEVLVIAASMAAVGLVLVLAAGLTAWRTLRARLPYVLRCAVWTVVTSVVLLAYPAWFALAGPAHLSGSIWGNGGILNLGGSVTRNFLHAAAPDPKVTALAHQFGGYQGPELSSQFVGWGVLAVLVIGLVVWHRDRRLWLFGLVGVVALLLSIGLRLDEWTAWRLVDHLPQAYNIIPFRFVLIVYLCAAVMLAIVTDHVYVLVRGPGDPGDGAAPLRAPGARARGVTAVVVAVAVSAVALVPIASYLSTSLPLTTEPVVLPAWFRTVAPHLSGSPVLLVFPPPFAYRQSSLTWQAVNRMSYAMAGGAGPGSIAQRAGAERAGEVYLGMIGFSLSATPVYPPDVASVRSAVDGWGVTTIVLPDPAGLPSYARVYPVRSIAVLMTAVMGGPPTYSAGAWVWSGVDHAGPPLVRTAGQLAACIRGDPQGPAASIDASIGCVMAPPGA